MLEVKRSAVWEPLKDARRLRGQLPAITLTGASLSRDLNYITYFYLYMSYNAIQCWCFFFIKLFKFYIVAVYRNVQSSGAASSPAGFNCGLTLQCHGILLSICAAKRCLLLTDTELWELLDAFALCDFMWRKALKLRL